MDIQKVSKFVNRYRNSLENLELNFFKLRSYSECFNLFGKLANLKSIKLNNCQIEKLDNEALKPIKSLISLTFNKCNDNVFKIFTKQESLEKLTVSNGVWTWNGFPHETFTEICENSKNLEYIELQGAGTGSYFDSDAFPFKIRKLNTTMITFHWYVGIRTQRINFLESQKGYLKELTIHELPYDFDGGRVLKYIINEMNLDKFYYGKIPLIINGQKQNVKEFEFGETQITSAYEMVKQFPSK